MQWLLSVDGTFCIQQSILDMGTVMSLFRYGGILLHGDRFKHINNVARILLLETGVGLEVNTE